MSLFWDMLHSKLACSFLIYHNFIIDEIINVLPGRMNWFMGWICIWPAGHS